VIFQPSATFTNEQKPGERNVQSEPKKASFLAGGKKDAKVGGKKPATLFQKKDKTK